MTRAAERETKATGGHESCSSSELELIRGLGHQILCVAIGCDTRLTSDATALGQGLEQLCRGRGLTVLERFTHAYEPHGLTVGLVIGESHIILHTWPEHDLVHVDLFSCVPLDREGFLDDLAELLGADCVRLLYSSREPA
jgi:S-adenosylmethionine decarboxylase